VHLRDALAAAIAKLSSSQTPSPRMNAELLMMFTLDCDRAYLHAHPERELSPEERTLYEAALQKRASGVPAQYITGHQEFWGLDFRVTPAVLIPRPETEHVIETVLKLTREPAGAGGPPAETFRIADVGTGSGCIALALAKELPRAEIYAIDFSAEALEIAQANAARLHLESHLRFQEGFLLQPFPDSFFDLVVSNPPYVGESEQDTVQLEVRKFEPRNAVFAGPTGLEVIARLVPQSQRTLKPGGWLVMEISGTIAERVRRLLLMESWVDVEITEDLQGIPRVASARKARR
jgi:release factor glutamine methyltransferase